MFSTRSLQVIFTSINHDTIFFQHKVHICLKVLLTPLSKKNQYASTRIKIPFQAVKFIFCKFFSRSWNNKQCYSRQYIEAYVIFIPEKKIVQIRNCINFTSKVLYFKINNEIRSSQNEPAYKMK